MVKNKFPGRLLFLSALVLGSCSDGGGDGVHEVPAPALPAAWRNLFRTPTSSNLRGVRFVNTNQGYVVGDSTSIFRTENGAAAAVKDIRWYHHEPQPTTRQGDLVATDILGGSAQAAGNDGAGGKTWASRGALDWYTADVAGSGSPMTDIDVVQSDQFGDNAVSFALRQNGDVVASGTGFSVANSGVTNAQGIDFIGTTGVGYVCGANGVINRCINSGQLGTDWTTMPFEPTTLNMTGKTLYAIQIGRTLIYVGATPVLTQSDIGYAVGDDGTLLVLNPITTTFPAAEDRWKLQNIAPGIRLYGVHFPLNHENGWAVGENGTIIKLNWVVPPGYPGTAPQPEQYAYTTVNQSVATTLDFFDVWFLDASTGYVVGEAGTVYRTTNGGATWVLISGGSLDHLNAMDFSADGQSGIAVGEGGVVARTLDGGESWSMSNAGLAGTVFYGVSVPKVGGLNTAFICGDGGVFRCLDITAPTLSWSLLTLPAGTYRQVHFAAGPSMGVCVGEDPAPGGSAAQVYSTANGDAALAGSVVWTAGTGLPADTSFFCVVSEPVSYNFYVGGAGGNIYTSTPATLPAWTAVASPSASQVLSLQAPGAGITLMAVFGDNTVRRLLTAGPLWQITGARTGTAASVGFADANNGYLVTQGAGKGLFRTTDGGSTWTPQLIHTSNTLRFAWASLLVPNLAFVCGENGTLLKTIVGGN